MTEWWRCTTQRMAGVHWCLTNCLCLIWIEFIDQHDRFSTDNVNFVGVSQKIYYTNQTVGLLSEPTSATKRAFRHLLVGSGIPKFKHSPNYSIIYNIVPFRGRSPKRSKWRYFRVAIRVLPKVLSRIFDYRRSGLTLRDDLGYCLCPKYSRQSPYVAFRVSCLFFLCFTIDSIFKLTFYECLSATPSAAGPTLSGNSQSVLGWVHLSGGNVIVELKKFYLMITLLSHRLYIHATYQRPTIHKHH